MPRRSAAAARENTCHARALPALPLSAAADRGPPVSQGAVVDIGASLDEGSYSGLQKGVLLLAALAVVLDGFDGQLIGFAIPVIMKEWHVTRAAFVPAVAAGLAGMALGSAGVGLLADRVGRRMALILSVFVFGLGTCAIGLAPDVATIAVLRFLAGLGIGGALPTATTLSAEFTPARRRTLAVTATIVCVPLGGMLAGLFAGQLIPVHGWRGLFLTGGALPLGYGLVLLAKLPESPRFLARRQARWPELAQLLTRMQRVLPPQATFSDRVEQASERRRDLGALFEQGLARDTLALWSAAFMCLLSIYTAFSWLPTMLTAEGLSPALAGSGLTAYNLGGVIGALTCALFIARFGSRRAMSAYAIGALASAFLLRGVDVRSSTDLFIIGLGVHGLFVNAVQSTFFALCAHVYTTRVRATGTATALAFGRLGAILSAFAGAAVITAGGAAAYLTLLGGAMSLVLAALLVVRRHIPPPGQAA